MRIVPLYYDSAQLIGRFSPNGSADELNTEAGHSLAPGILFSLGNKFRDQEGNGGLAEFRFKFNAVADDRRRADTSMSHPDHDTICLFFDLRP
jgi:hypothetical protein